MCVRDTGPRALGRGSRARGIRQARSSRFDPSPPHDWGVSGGDSAARVCGLRGQLEGWFSVWWRLFLCGRVSCGVVGRGCRWRARLPTRTLGSSSLVQKSSPRASFLTCKLNLLGGYILSSTKITNTTRGRRNNDVHHHHLAAAPPPLSAQPCRRQRKGRPRRSRSTRRAPPGSRA